MQRRNFIKLAAKGSVAAAIAADPVAQLSASIVTRSRRYLEKPANAVVVNWGHPLAMGLDLVVPFTEGQGVTTGSHPILDASGHHDITVNNNSGNVAWVQNTPGKGLYLAGNADFATAFGPLRGTRDGFTALLIQRKTDTTTRTSASFAETSFTADSFSGLVPWSDGTIYLSYGGIAPPNRLTYAGISWDTKPHMFAFSAGGKGSSIWMDGQKLASQSTAINLVSDRVNVKIGNTWDNFGDLVEFYFFAIAGEQWSDDLISWWFAEPYGMFVPLSPKTSYLFGGSGRKKTNVFVAQ
jgi:hypothetical protein